MGRGSTFSAITQDEIRELRILLPALPEQRRIAAILDKADDLRKKRAESFRLAGEFLKGTFLELFGDPVRNPKGWHEEPLESFCEIVSGVTKGRNFTGKKTVMVPYMRVANVQDGYLDISTISDIEVLPLDIERYRLVKGDILLTEGGDPDKLGRGAVWQGEIETCIHQNHIFRVRPKPHVAEPHFLSSLIGSARGKRYFLKAAKQTTGIASINMTQLKAFPALLPPIDLQGQFGTLLAHCRKYEANCKIAAGESERLAGALAQSAFQGDF